MNEVARFGVLAGTAGAAVSPQVQLLLGALAAVALVACGAVALGRELAGARRARAWERQATGPRPSTGTAPLTAAETTALEEIAWHLKAGRARHAAPRRRRTARRKSERAGNR